MGSSPHGGDNDHFTPDTQYPERFAQQALRHNSKAVHHACSKHAEGTVPSLDDWEKGFLDVCNG
jgi:hypothetical protein